MTDNTENPQKKANLIKQPKARPLAGTAAPQATPQESEDPAPATPVRSERGGAADHDASGEKRKVVVVKKKVVVKKPQARVVAHHEEGAAPVEEKSAQPAADRSQTPSRKPGRRKHLGAGTAHAEGPRAAESPQGEAPRAGTAHAGPPERKRRGRNRRAPPLLSQRETGRHRGPRTATGQLGAPMGNGSDRTYGPGGSPSSQRPGGYGDSRFPSSDRSYGPGSGQGPRPGGGYQGSPPRPGYQGQGGYQGIAASRLPRPGRLRRTASRRYQGRAPAAAVTGPRVRGAGGGVWRPASRRISGRV